MKSMKLAIVAATLSFAACATPTADPKAGVDFRVTSIDTDKTTANTTCDSGGQKFIQADEAKANLENKPAPNSEGADVIIEKYSVDYFPEDGGPDLNSLTDVLTTNVVKKGSTGSLQVIGFSEEAKKQFFNATTNTTNFSTVRLYNLHYTIDGKTEFGETVSAEGDLSMRLGNVFVNVTCK